MSRAIHGWGNKSSITVRKRLYLCHSMGSRGNRWTTAWWREANEVLIPHDLSRIEINNRKKKSGRLINRGMFHCTCASLKNEFEFNSGPLFTKKTSSYRNRDSHYKPKRCDRRTVPFIELLGQMFHCTCASLKNEFEFNSGLYSLRRRRLIGIGIPIINLRRSSVSGL